MTERDFWREGYDAYNSCDTPRQKNELSCPDDIQPRHREEWREGWLDAAAEDPDNDEVILRDQGTAFDQIH